jgi:phage terminase small subunit
VKVGLDVRAFWDALAASVDRLTLAGWIQIISAIGAVAAAIAGVSAARAARGAARTAARQLPELQKQVEISAAQSKAADEQVVLTQEVLKAATAAVREAARARTDERAPLVIALFEAPQWPPLIDATRDRMPYGNELRLLDHRSVAQAEAASPARLFTRNAERTQLMWFQTRGVLINEGATTARVRLDDAAQFVEATAARRERLLRPGEIAPFEWGAGHTIAEWAAARERPDPPNPLGACFLTITVFDSFEQGIFDHIHVVMSGRPIVPVDDSFDEVRLASRQSEADMEVTVFPTRRTYRSDGARRDPLPWDGTYAAWWKEHGRRATELA